MPTILAHNWLRHDCDGGAVFTRGCEVHVEWQKGKEVRFVRAARKVFAEVLSELGFLTTRQKKSQSPEFLERVGFRKTWSDDEFDYFLTTAVPLARGEKHVMG